MKSRTLVAASVLVTLAVVACSSAPPATTSSKSTKNTDETDPTPGATPPTGASTPGATPDTPPSSSTTPAACATKTTADDCYSCCDDANPKASDFWNTAFQNAACTTPGTCKTQCAASFCAGTDPADGDACATCLDNTDALYDAADKACDADAECSKVTACYDASKCDSKESPDGGP